MITPETFKTDFSGTLMRCSALGSLMTEPKSKADREAGELSETAKDYLMKTYVFEKYKRTRDITSKEIRKGNLCEEDSINLLSFVSDHIYTKNKKKLSNEFITGTPDIIEPEGVIDIKTSWDFVSFLMNLVTPISKSHFYQLQGYMALTGSETSNLIFCLVNAPEVIVNDEKKRLFYMMNVVTEENEEYKEAAAELEFNLTFNNVPPNERVLKFKVDREDAEIEKVYAKVKKCREYLIEIEEKHRIFTKQYRSAIIEEKIDQFFKENPTFAAK